VHRPQCEPPPIDEEWTKVFGPLLGYAWDGTNMAQLPLPIYGEHDDMAFEVRA